MADKPPAEMQSCVAFLDSLTHTCCCNYISKNNSNQLCLNFMHSRSSVFCKTFLAPVLFFFCLSSFQVLVENGTKEGHQMLMEARDLILHVMELHAFVASFRKSMHPVHLLLLVWGNLYAFPDVSLKHGCN